jgi:hypothetical protein
LQARRRSGQVTLPPRVVSVNADGTFEFLNVPAGEYALTAAPAGGGAEPEFALQMISVAGSDMPPVTIRTAPMASISGRIEVVEGAGAGPMSFFAVVDSDYPVRPGTVAPGPDGTFVLRRLAGPVRFTSRNSPAGSWLKAVNIGGINAVEEPVVFNGADSSRTDVTVVFAVSAGHLSGRVVDERGAAADDYRVVVFSTNRERWFAGSQFLRIVGGPDVNGGFTVPSLPPGDYFVAAVDGIDGDADTGDWQNPDVLAALSASAQRVTVGERQRAVADVKLIRWQR